ncbi:hypothetical protein FHP05_09080 [Cerasibacillus terrae]|uniref:DUF5780 domain-containing protein n=1 Tax=Cerasibacillus terrae TaxID=2498845 RepID=A0A5C8NTJ7_9BACI|nr:DUF5780 domain-containing protein [Cerasibacillus terrae]TXL64462.1 hypothetical protein FHP05_09080 [Cerasibacillus terrae]
MNKLFKVNFIIICILLMVACSNESNNTKQKENSHEEQTSESSVENVTENESNQSKTSTDEKKEIKEVEEKPKMLTEEEMKRKIEEQSLKVISKDYIIQDEDYKTLYPDMLQVIIENNSGTDIKNAVIAYAAWDENGLPLKIQSDSPLDSGKYIPLANAEDINLIDGATYGEESGFSISENMDQIEEFEAIVVSYETFDDETWENELFDDFKRLYEGQRRKD